MLRNGQGAALVVAWVLAAAGSADELHSALCLHGCPAGFPETNDVLVRPIYVLSSNDTTKFADWVAYRVTEVSIGATRERRWKADPELAARETLEPDDNRRANAVLKTDCGHQAPLASTVTETSLDARKGKRIGIVLDHDISRCADDVVMWRVWQRPKGQE